MKPIVIGDALERSTEEGSVVFRDYWDRVSSQLESDVDLINAVIMGKTTVSNAIVEQCQCAVMRLVQIESVLYYRLYPKVFPSERDDATALIKRVEHEVKGAKSFLAEIISWQTTAKITFETPRAN